MRPSQRFQLAPALLAALCLAALLVPALWAARPPVAGKTPPGKLPPAATAPATSPASAPAPKLELYSFKHYFFNTDLPNDQAKLFGNHMDAVFDEYQQRFAGYKPRDPRKLDVFLFSRHDDYTAELKKAKIDATNSGGMFVSNEKLQGLYSFTQKRTRSDVFEVLQHEGFHQFALNYIGPRLPIWVNEGLAQYFEDGLLLKGGMTLGLVPPYRLEVVKQALKDDAGDEGFAKLLDSTDEQWQQAMLKDQPKVRLFYAESWSVCHFFMHADQGKQRASFGAFMLNLSQGKEVREAFTSAFGGKTVESFAPGWRRYVLALEPDPLMVTVDRLQVLGIALQSLEKRNETIPASMDALKAKLRGVQYEVRRTRGTVMMTHKATEDSFFTYPTGPAGAAGAPGKTGAFEMLPPAKPDQLSRITAPMLKPQPTLTWYRDGANDLVAEIEFK